VLLNLDAGELPSETEELWALADVLAIACGGHAGDAASMWRVAAFAATAGKQIGAHVSYPDREGFGRRTMKITYSALAESVEAQLAALAATVRQVADAARVPLAVTYVKPHGALYHDATRDPKLAAIVTNATRTLVGEITLIGPPRGELAVAARLRGIRYLREGFADRHMRPDGTLVPRTEPNALITSPSEAAIQARWLRDIDIICVHGDTPNAIAIASAVRSALAD
jgi:5-oxoprolinase (ATP-hydrolysing) subunit A